MHQRRSDSSSMTSTRLGGDFFTAGGIAPPGRKALSDTGPGDSFTVWASIRNQAPYTQDPSHGAAGHLTGGFDEFGTPSTKRPVAIPDLRDLITFLNRKSSVLRNHRPEAVAGKCIDKCGKFGRRWEGFPGAAGSDPPGDSEH
jgi:hypothetical protein